MFNPSPRFTVAGSADNDTVTTGALDTSGSSLIVLAIAMDPLPSAVPTDSLNNKWIPLGLSSGGAATGIRFWYSVNPAVGAAHTFTMAATGKFPTIAVQAWGGDVEAPTARAFTHDLVEAGTFSAGSVASLQPDAAWVPSQPFELVLAAVSHVTAVTAVSVDSGFTITNTFAATANAYGLSFAYKRHAGGGGLTPKFSWTTAVGASMRVAGFQSVTGFRGEVL